jgi:hypothetical protein
MINLASFHQGGQTRLRLSAVDTLKGYFKALECEYRVKTVVLGTLKYYSIFSLTLYMAWYSAYSIHREGPTAGAQRARELPEAVSEWTVAAPLAKQRKKCYNSQTKNPN